MIQEYKDIIIRNFVTLVKECKVDDLAKLMVDKGVFTEKERNAIFSTDNVRHNKRVFFFTLQKKDTNAFKILITTLKETNQNYLAELLMSKRTGCKVFQEEQVFDDVPGSVINLEQLPRIRTPLDIQVIPSSRFYDTFQDNRHIQFYETRSKKRGRVLIINNYDFNSHEHPYRNGATVDNENLENLFAQMGGWDMKMHINKSAAEMKSILKTFAQDETNIDYDIICVIIMSHGNERQNDTIIYGVDEQFIHSLAVQKIFSNEHSRWMRGKPKIFLLPVCRGSNRDFLIRHDQAHKTETDSVMKGPSSPLPSVTNYIRSEGDMLIGYSTSLGYSAHRCPDRGSWYIDVMCEKFMNHAHDTPVDNLLIMIDDGLSKMMSEMCTMQTAEYRNKGFKKLYLHPGIFWEDGKITKFHE